MSLPRRILTVFAVAALAVAGLIAAGSGADASPPTPSTLPAPPVVSGVPDLGPNVYVFTPSMSQASIQSTLDAIAAQQLPNQFGTQRYAILFEPGSYGSAADPLVFQVGYYTEVAGLGTQPTDVQITGSVDVYNQCDDTSGCIALNNFWRSLSNLTITVAGGSGCQSNTEFWAVSQAAPMRRVNVVGNSSLMDYCSAGPQYASGGFIADSAFSGSVVNGSQQQFVVRNSSVGSWSNGVWNQVFAGVDGAPAQSFGQPGANPYTTLATSPVTQEEPFLSTDTRGRLQVSVPGVQTNSSGTSWSAPTTTAPLSSFFVARPSTSIVAIDLALALGKNLILTPGVYNLAAPILITRPNTIVLGLGFATLVPQHGTQAIWALTSRGVKLSGLILDAGPKTSPALLQLDGNATAAAPALVQDVFFRVGGATPGSVNTAAVIDSAHTILDDVWVWRADHGAGVGWSANTAPRGLVVNGDDVTAYGLFVEHFQQTEVAWNGNGGEVVFFQNEMPYDVPGQSSWMSGPTVKGYAAFAVGPKVKTFTGYGMGSYSFFNQGLDIHATQAFQAPNTPGVQFHGLLTVFLNGSGGIDSVINGTGPAANSTNGGSAQLVVSYP